MNVLCRFRRNVLCDLMLHFCNFGRDRIVPAALLLPLALGVEGALWAGPLADAPAFITTLVMLRLYWKKFKNIRLPTPADGAKEADKAVPPGHPD